MDPSQQNDDVALDHVTELQEALRECLEGIDICASFGYSAAVARRHLAPLLRYWKLVPHAEDEPEGTDA